MSRSTAAGDFRLTDRLLGHGPRLTGEFDVDRRLVNALLPGQLLRVEPQAALPRRLQAALPSPIATRLCLRRRTHWGPPLP